MQDERERASSPNASFPRLLAGAFAVVLAALSPSATETAIANGDTRTLYLYHTHTHEQIAATYLVDGHYDSAVLKQLNWFLRDWRRDEPTSMDPRLFDVVWEAYRQAGATEPVHIVSAYRSPETNAALRRRSRGVAKHSQHMLGKAMDTTMPGMPMSHIREIGMRMQRGGVGYYPSSGTPFVHLDVGSVRAWPRMSYDQLVRLFPDGKTVHLPSNGPPLSRYAEAKAEIEARGAIVQPPSDPKTRSLLAFLFGGGNEDDEDGAVAVPAPASRKQWASLAPRDARASRLDGEEAGESAPPERRPEAIARAEANLPKGETTLGPGPGEEPTAKPAAAPAPLPPEKPKLALAEPEPASDGKPGLSADFPLPPRRPAITLAEAAPLPPVRPLELASLLRASDVTAPLTTKEAPAPTRKKAEPVLAYAPKDEAPAPALHALAPAKPPLPPAPSARAAFTPARLDHSNFGAMTGAASAARSPGGSVIGSPIAPRSAARSGPSMLTAALASGYVSAFAPQAGAPPADRFSQSR